MKKKIMAVTLCLAMVSTFAVGCGQKNETDSGKSEEKSSGKVEIEFVQVKREAAESYTKVIEAFEKENPDIVIKQNVVPDAQEVLMTRASSDSLPDMMNHWPTDAQFVQFEDEGLLLDLSEKDYMKNIDSKYLDAVKAKDGKNYIAPYNVNFMGVYYNKDKFEEAGYTMPTKWDELIALMREIQVQKLTKDNFGKYGEFLDLLDESELKKKSIFQEGFFADVVALEFNQGNQPTISVCHVKKQSENIISFLEAHQYACEGLLPLDGDVIIFVGIMDSDFRTESIEAFYVPKGTFVKLNPLIVHGTQYPVDKEDVHIVCMLPGRTFKNDMLSRRLETGEQIRITRGYKK